MPPIYSREGALCRSATHATAPSFVFFQLSDVVLGIKLEAKLGDEV